MSAAPTKKLVIIEATFAASTPAAQSLCKALPHVLDAGWKVEIWSSVSALVESRARLIRVPRWTRSFVVHFWFFSLWVTLRYLWRRITGALRQDDLVMSIGPYMPWANLMSIHFISVEYLKQIDGFGNMIRPSRLEWLAHWLVSLLERAIWKLNSGRRVWMVVSSRLCSALRNHVGTRDLFTVFPNSYNATRFHPEVRREWRDVTRTQLGIPRDMPVFAFVCLGGFERKGFPLALKACALLNASGTPCRLLVVGGPDSNPPDLRGLACMAGVDDLSFVSAHGRDPQIERLLSAADALLFPSYFEAFSLVEIESAALGLRLYLTPHFGSEMILQDGLNGRLLPWDAPGIAAVLEEDIRSGKLAEGCHSAYQALPDTDIGQAFLVQLEQARGYILGGNPALAGGSPQKFDA